MVEEEYKTFVQCVHDLYGLPTVNQSNGASSSSNSSGIMLSEELRRKKAQSWLIEWQEEPGSSSRAWALCQHAMQRILLFWGIHDMKFVPAKPSYDLHFVVHLLAIQIVRHRSRMGWAVCGEEVQRMLQKHVFQVVQMVCRIENEDIPSNFVEVACATLASVIVRSATTTWKSWREDVWRLLDFQRSRTLRVVLLVLSGLPEELMHVSSANDWSLAAELHNAKVHVISLIRESFALPDPCCHKAGLECLTNWLQSNCMMEAGHVDKFGISIVDLSRGGLATPLLKSLSSEEHELAQAAGAAINDILSFKISYDMMTSEPSTVLDQRKCILEWIKGMLSTRHFFHQSRDLMLQSKSQLGNCSMEEMNAHLELDHALIICKNISTILASLIENHSRLIWDRTWILQFQEEKDFDAESGKRVVDYVEDCISFPMVEVVEPMLEFCFFAFEMHSDWEASDSTDQLNYQTSIISLMTKAVPTLVKQCVLPHHLFILDDINQQSIELCDLLRFRSEVGECLLSLSMKWPDMPASHGTKYFLQIFTSGFQNSRTHQEIEAYLYITVQLTEILERYGDERGMDDFGEIDAAWEEILRIVSLCPPHNMIQNQAIKLYHTLGLWVRSHHTVIHGMLRVLISCIEDAFLGESALRCLVAFVSSGEEAQPMVYDTARDLLKSLMISYQKPSVSSRLHGKTQEHGYMLELICRCLMPHGTDSTNDSILEEIASPLLQCLQQGTQNLKQVIRVLHLLRRCVEGLANNPTLELQLLHLLWPLLDGYISSQYIQHQGFRNEVLAIYKEATSCQKKFGSFDLLSGIVDNCLKWFCDWFDIVALECMSKILATYQEVPDISAHFPKMITQMAQSVFKHTAYAWNNSYENNAEAFRVRYTMTKNLAIGIEGFFRLAADHIAEHPSQWAQTMDTQHLSSAIVYQVTEISAFSLLIMQEPDALMEILRYIRSTLRANHEAFLYTYTHLGTFIFHGLFFGLQRFVTAPLQRLLHNILFEALHGPRTPTDLRQICFSALSQLCQSSNFFQVSPSQPSSYVDPIQIVQQFQSHHQLRTFRKFIQQFTKYLQSIP